MGSVFGRILRIATWGESHGPAVGVVLDGCPPGTKIDAGEIARELARRRPGQSRITTQRKEEDLPEILSGVVKGRATGTPISILVRNTDARGEAYDRMKEFYRPSHADFTYEAKYGLRDPYGGGRASARETIGRVAAGAIAKRILHDAAGSEILAYVSRVHKIDAPSDPMGVRAREVEGNIVRTSDARTAKRMIAAIERARRAGDSLGGIITCVARNVPAGLGDPVFDKLEACLAQAMLSLPAVKGFEVGSGFAGTRMTGARHNDPFARKGGKIVTTQNLSGGIQGGISNGMPILFRVAFKPTSTIATPQKTVTRAGRAGVLVGHGRHDPCVLPRAVPIVEAMAALVLADALLVQCAVARRAVRGR